MDKKNKENQQIANQDKDAKAVSSNPPAHIYMESALGAVLLLAIRSNTHKYLFSADYEWLILPAIASRQFTIFRNKKNEPIAYISWADVNEEIEKRLLSGTTKLQPKDWKSGDKKYVIDIISPFVPQSEILKQLSQTQFKDKEQELNILAPKKEGRGVEAKTLKDLLTEIEQNENAAKKSKLAN